MTVFAVVGLLAAILAPIPSNKARFARAYLILPSLALGVLGVGWAQADGLGAASADVRPRAAGELRVASNNLRYDTGGQLATVESLIERWQPDVVLLQELVPSTVPELEESDLVGAYPFRYYDAREGVQGSGILSSVPMEGETIWVAGWPMTKARLMEDWEETTIVNVHTVAPLDDENIALWRAQFDDLAQLARETEGSLVLMGDFNATGQHTVADRMAEAGLRDSRRLVGSGWPGTFPSWSPLAMLRLDWLLVDDSIEPVFLVASDTAVTDHRALVGQIRHSR